MAVSGLQGCPHQPAVGAPLHLLCRAPAPGPNTGLTCLPACRIEKACLGTIAEGKYLTRDLGGKSGTTDFTKAIIGRLDD